MPKPRWNVIRCSDISDVGQFSDIREATKIAKEEAKKTKATVMICPLTLNLPIPEILYVYPDGTTEYGDVLGDIE